MRSPANRSSGRRSAGHRPSDMATPRNDRRPARFGPGPVVVYSGPDPYKSAATAAIKEAVVDLEGEDPQGYDPDTAALEDALIELIDEVNTRTPREFDGLTVPEMREIGTFVQNVKAGRRGTSAQLSDNVVDLLIRINEERNGLRVHNGTLFNTPGGAPPGPRAVVPPAAVDIPDPGTGRFAAIVDVANNALNNPVQAQFYNNDEVFTLDQAEAVGSLPSNFQGNAPVTLAVLGAAGNVARGAQAAVANTLTGLLNMANRGIGIANRGIGILRDAVQVEDLSDDSENEDAGPRATTTAITLADVNQDPILDPTRYHLLNPHLPFEQQIAVFPIDIMDEDAQEPAIVRFGFHFYTLMGEYIQGLTVRNENQIDGEGFTRMVPTVFAEGTRRLGVLRNETFRILQPTLARIQRTREEGGHFLAGDHGINRNTARVLAAMQRHLGPLRDRLLQRVNAGARTVGTLALVGAREVTNAAIRTAGNVAGEIQTRAPDIAVAIRDGAVNATGAIMDGVATYGPPAATAIRDGAVNATGAIMTNIATYGPPAATAIRDGAGAAATAVLGGVVAGVGVATGAIQRLGAAVAPAAGTGPPPRGTGPIRRNRVRRDSLQMLPRVGEEFGVVEPVAGPMNDPPDEDPVPPGVPFTAGDIRPGSISDVRAWQARRRREGLQWRFTSGTQVREYWEEVYANTNAKPVNHDKRNGNTELKRLTNNEERDHYRKHGDFRQRGGLDIQTTLYGGAGKKKSDAV